MYNKVTLGQLQKITPHVSVPRPGGWMGSGAGTERRPSLGMFEVFHAPQCPRDSVASLTPLLSLVASLPSGPTVAVEVAAGPDLSGGLL